VAFSEAFEIIIKFSESQNHKPPNLILTDEESKYENKYFESLLNNFNNKIYHSQNFKKSVIIDICNHTLNNLMKVPYEVKNNIKSIDISQNVLDEYNFKDKHRSIVMTPSEVNKSKENLVFGNLQRVKQKRKQIPSW